MKPETTDEIAKTSAEATFRVSTGYLVSGIFSAIGLSLLVRFLGPISYGQFIVILILPNFMFLFQDWAVSQAITRYVSSYLSKNKSTCARRVIFVGSVFLIISAIVLTSISYLISDLFASIILQAPELIPLIRFSSLIIIGRSLITIGSSILLGLNKSGRYSATIVTSSILQDFIPIIFVMVGLNFHGAIFGKTIGALVAGGISTILLIRAIPKKDQNITYKRNPFHKDLRTLTWFGLPIFLSTLAGGAYLRFLETSAAIFLDPLILGNYFAAFTLANVVSYITMPISLVLFPTFSKMDQPENEKIIEIFYKSSIKYAATVIVPIIALVIIVAQPLVQFLFGPAYSITWIFLILSIGTYFYSVIGGRIIGSFLRGQGKTVEFLLTHVVLFISGLGFASLLTPTLLAFGLLITNLIAYFLATLAGIIFVRKSYGFFPDFSTAIKLLLCAIISITPAVAIITFLPTHILLRIIIATSVFAICYFMTFGLLKTLTERDLSNLQYLFGSLGRIGKPGSKVISLLKRAFYYKNKKPKQ